MDESLVGLNFKRLNLISVLFSNSDSQTLGEGHKNLSSDVVSVKSMVGVKSSSWGEGNQVSTNCSRGVS